MVSKSLWVHNRTSQVTDRQADAFGAVSDGTVRPIWVVFTTLRLDTEATIENAHLSLIGTVGRQESNPPRIRGPFSCGGRNRRVILLRSSSWFLLLNHWLGRYNNANLSLACLEDRASIAGVLIQTDQTFE